MSKERTKLSFRFDKTNEKQENLTTNIGQKEIKTICKGDAGNLTLKDCHTTTPIFFLPLDF